MKFLKYPLIVAVTLLCSFAFVACSSDDDDESIPNSEAGKIPGLGNAPGEFAGTPFSLPAGISLEGQLMGYVDDLEMPMSSTSTRKAKVADIRGSGGHVSVQAIMLNAENKDTEVIFPAGLIIRAHDLENQHGILIKEVKVTVPAKGKLYVPLFTYCANAGKAPSSSSDVYSFAVVSDSRLLNDLFKRVKNKKINTEEYDLQEEYNKWFDDDYKLRDTYYHRVSELQGIVWRITNYKGLSQYDIKYINELPNSAK